MSEVSVTPDVKPVSGLRLAHGARRKQSQTRRIWIDLDNSPHVPFFAPIIEELENSGHSVIVTVRDCFQVRELADLLHLNYRCVGRHYGKNIFWKLTGLCWRSLQLLSRMLLVRPQIALSHGSRSQLVVANLLRIPSVTVADYEFAKLWMLVRPTWVITPEVIPSEQMRCSEERILKYPGIKEDVYVPRFKPDSSIVSKLGLNPSTDLIVLVRPPATEAHYHRPESDELFTAVLDFLGSKPQVRMILLPRNEQQAGSIRSRWRALVESGQIVMPSRVTDGLNLIWSSDLVISCGGTMNREAAALGVPVYSIFRGELGAVDRYLVSAGRLKLIERPQDLAGKLLLIKRDRTRMIERPHSDALNVIVEHVNTILSRTV